MGTVSKLPTGKARQLAQERIRSRQQHEGKAAPSAANDPNVEPGLFARASKQFALAMACATVGAVTTPLSWFARPARKVVHVMVFGLAVFVAVQAYKGWPDPQLAMKSGAAAFALLAVAVAAKAGMRSLHSLERRLRRASYEG